MLQLFGSYANDQNSQALAVLHVAHKHAARRAQELAQRAKQEIRDGGRIDSQTVGFYHRISECQDAVQCGRAHV